MHITDDRLPVDQNGTREAKSPVVKRSIVVAGHKTSVSLEDAFWAGLKEIAGGRHLTLSDMVATEICHRPFACSCSTSIADSSPSSKPAGPQRMT